MRNRQRARASRLAGVALAGLGLSGCASFWDDITSRDFEFRSMFSRPNPFQVLQDSTDGDKRAKALRALHEPKQHGGTDRDQEVVLKILATAATTERQPWCRLAAIQSLGRFKDPRAVEALVHAFENAPFEKPYERPPRLFAPETANVLQTQALTALGETRNPAALELLVRVAREPAPASTVADQERQHWVDRHLAAVRALGHFNQSQATEALVSVLQKEKNVALRNQAHASLQKATGKKLPPDAQAWEEYLHAPHGEKATASTDNTNPIQRVKGWFTSESSAAKKEP